MPNTNDNKASGADAQKKIEMTPQEFADIKKFMSESAAKDAKIADLSGLVAELKKSIENTDPTVSELEVEAVETGKYARMRKYEDKWVLGWTDKGVYRERNKLNEIIEYMDIIIQGEKDPVKIALLDLLNLCPQEIVEIKNRKPLKDIVKDEGLVPAMVFDEKTGEHRDTGRKIRSRVVSKHCNIVLILDGKEVTVHEKFVNQ